MRFKDYRMKISVGQEWGDSNIKDTMAVINFLAKRFNKLNFYSYYKVPYV